MATTAPKLEARGGESRREALLDAAAEMFAAKGYDGTSIRDIAGAVGMLPGSLYYHFKSKEDLLIAVYRKGVARFEAAIDQALASTGADPWQAIEAACAAHLSILLDGGDYARIVNPEFVRSFPAEMLPTLNAERDRYERHFEKLIAALPLAAETDRWLFKVALFGSLNWSQTWYRKGRYTPQDIAAAFIGMLRKQDA
ncbi:TetR/AcrR family transcriptional regulator [Novosphingobium sp. NDB2Meth1]|uniref:TetR/AcrR family transcriptional regulator n=1 Tax=Novosphingobium sp. NDB2Meth1 TaxID=1892847 RepID=UPI000930F70C|nr:TetR/AcrR family transcriptional regulator [Novosphingobium sp. NDB2Meth1]